VKNDARADAPYDLLVIGGGITGAGIALDAASRGLRTVLVERGDFAAGTSSRSSKLVHGGLRYLEQLSLGLMYESIAERHLLTRLAPGLVRWRPFLLPSFRGKGKKWKASLGLWLYDHLARAPAELRHRRLPRREALRIAPGLRQEGMRGAASFYDCVTDDARLVLSIMLDAQARGARVHNYTTVEEVLREGGRAAGARLRDALTGASWEVRARQVVSASGPWTDRVLELAGEFSREKRIRPAKGVHIVLARGRIEISSVVMIPSARDRRSLFVIPWYEGILVGTTDTDYVQSADGVRPEAEDVDYILAALDWAFPAARVSRADVVSSYAGVRPLVNAPGKSTADVPREYRIFEGSSGMLSVAGGKLTTYRRMARVVVDRVVRRLRRQGVDRPVLPCWTHRIPIGSPPEEGFDAFRGCDLPDDVRAHLVADYGLWSRQIVSILELHPVWARPMADGLPYILAEAYFAAAREKARTLTDVLARRTRVALLAADQGRGCADDVSRILAGELGWSEEERLRQIAEYERVLREELRAGSAL
jgi:glycerol-3-phosphate dehydrogenase